MTSTTLTNQENLISTEDFITELFYRIDEALKDNKKLSQGKLYASEIITLALLYALSGKGQLAFWRWLNRAYKPLFPHLPCRTRLFHLFNSHQHYTEQFMADPSLLGVTDSYGIEFIHPIREGRSDKQIGRKGLSNHRWIVGGKLCLLLNHLGLIVAWACDTANVYDGSSFHKLVDDVSDEMVVLADTSFKKVDWQPDNLKICQKGEWNERMLIETVLSMLTYICDFKHSRHKAWEYFKTKLGYTMALFNILGQWFGLQEDDKGFVPLSIAQFSL